MTAPAPEVIADINGTRICYQTFGDPDDDAVLLIGGNASSMVWWDRAFCETVAAAGRFVIRYDHRDTGRSELYPPGHPGYTGLDLIEDAVALLDHLGLHRAHVVGVSMGGAFAQLIAVDRPDRVLTLTLMSTSATGPGDGGLPPISDELASFFVTAQEPDPADRAAVLATTLAYSRALAGRGAFDESYIAGLVAEEYDRAPTAAASGRNHMLVEGAGAWRDRLPTVTAPTLVLHGDSDPLFQPAHADALAAEIPGAALEMLADTGHVYTPAAWSAAATAIVRHTQRAAS